MRISSFSSQTPAARIYDAVGCDDHPHDFLIDGMTYAMFEVDGVLDFADPGTTADDRKVRLQKVLKPGSRFLYRYDFGDGWDHAIVVEKTETVESEPWGAAQVIDGARACPPEDVGGPHGYGSFLTTLRNHPNSEEAEHYRNWVGPGFDAELFDLRAANATHATHGFKSLGKPVTHAVKTVSAPRLLCSRFVDDLC
ncbi:protein of unknown function [Burkholderia multivorans]